MLPQQLSSPSLLLQLPSLPTTPGVYIFKEGNEIIYVGKANNLKRRVSSYFKPSVDLGPKTSLLVSKVTSMEYINVNSEIEALLLESKLINKFNPSYNFASKDDKSPYFIHLTHEEYPRPVINHEPDGAFAGPFLNSLIPKRILRSFRRIAPFCTAKRPVKKPCFYSHIGLCHPCPGNINVPDIKKEYQKNISRLKRLLRGNFLFVRSSLRKEMQIASEARDYEKAAELRDYLSSLEYLLTSPVNPNEYLSNPNLLEDTKEHALNSLLKLLQPFFINIDGLNRIESFDISHLSGKYSTAAMTVCVGGSITPSLYRHFRIKYSQTNSDVSMMSEVLNRRLNRLDWPVPDLIVLDGGKPQLSIIKTLSLDSRKLPPIIALSKPFNTIVIPENESYREINLPADHPGLLLLQNVCQEAHRFSRRLHHKYRAKIILS